MSMTNLKVVLLPNHSYFFLPSPLLLYILILYFFKKREKKVTLEKYFNTDLELKQILTSYYSVLVVMYLPLEPLPTIVN